MTALWGRSPRERIAEYRWRGTVTRLLSITHAV